MAVSLLLGSRRPHDRGVVRNKQRRSVYIDSPLRASEVTTFGVRKFLFTLLLPFSKKGAACGGEVYTSVNSHHRDRVYRYPSALAEPIAHSLGQNTSVPAILDVHKGRDDASRVPRDRGHQYTVVEDHLVVPLNLRTACKVRTTLVLQARINHAPQVA